MPRRPSDHDEPSASPEPPPTPQDAAQQVWLAGLGMIAKAQEEGGKVFEALVREGLHAQHKTQSTAGERLGEAAQRMSGLASDLGARAAGQWDRLEDIFEQRVAKALQRLGVPTAEEVRALHARIDALAQALERAEARPAPRRAARGAND